MAGAGFDGGARATAAAGAGAGAATYFIIVLELVKPLSRVTPPWLVGWTLHVDRPEVPIRIVGGLKPVPRSLPRRNTWKPPTAEPWVISVLFGPTTRLTIAPSGHTRSASIRRTACQELAAALCTAVACSVQLPGGSWDSVFVLEVLSLVCARTIENASNLQKITAFVQTREPSARMLTLTARPQGYRCCDV